MPRWRRDAKELFYLSPDRKLMAAAVRAAPGAPAAFQAEAPLALFEARVPNFLQGSNQFVYTVAADGKRFLVNTTVGDAVDTPLTVVVNWLAAVKK